jgi:hypothetical protein
MTIRFVMNDGGRRAAGFRGDAGDCATRAIAIATGLPYREVYALVNALAKDERYRRGRVGFAAATGRGSSAREGVLKDTMRRVMDSLGWLWTPTMRVGAGCKVHLRADELPRGRIVAAVSRHYVAVIEGVIYDTYDPSRDGTRCVYGYWSAP